MAPAELKELKMKLEELLQKGAKRCLYPTTVRVYTSGHVNFFESSYALDQKKAMGLCLKCGEKYHIGHKCNSKGIHEMLIQ